MAVRLNLSALRDRVGTDGDGGPRPFGTRPERYRDVATILVADDLDSIRRLFRYALQGHTMLEAATGEEALVLLVRHRPDVAFLDIMMDGLSGDQVCRAARSDPALAATRIVLMSAHARPEVDQHITEVGADFFLRKPFIISQLLALVA